MGNSFITKDRNDELSLLRGLDLQELLVETENYFLEYRDTLDLPNSVTFGTEIEYEDVFKILIDIYIKRKLKDWSSKSDGSLNFGGEITSPVMIDVKHYWQNLKMICNYLTILQADTSKNAGGHVHIGAKILGDDAEAWRQFIKLYVAYENVLFKFGYGDKINGRNNIKRYAQPNSGDFYNKLSELNKARDICDIYENMPVRNRYSAVNFSNVCFYNMSYEDKNTIEFRIPNATTSEIIWQNNINTFAKMVLTSSRKLMDEEFLDYKLKNEFMSSNTKTDLYLYNKINLKNALEFVDLTFDNNLDKISFLRQYLKGMESNNTTRKSAVKAKKFTK